MKHVYKLGAGVLLLGQAFSGAALAASVTLSGNTVDYTFDDAMLDLFGPASLSGDTLYFTPVSFQAESLNGDGFALTKSTMNIEVSAHDGWSFSNMALSEQGDYLLLGASSTADVSGQIRVRDVASPLADMTASIHSSAPLDQTGLPTTNWTAGAAVDLSAWNDSRTVNVTVQNLLMASTAGGSSLAFVDKKFVGLTPTMAEVSPVPEANAYAMMLAGLGLIGWKVGRRRIPLSHR